MKRSLAVAVCSAIAIMTGCSGSSSSSTPSTSASGGSTTSGAASSSSPPSSGSSSSASASSIASSSNVANVNGPPMTDVGGDPVFDSNGNLDADVVVQAFDELRFDKKEYDGKADLTIGLFNQGTMHYTLVIEGKDLKLEVFNHGDGAVGDIKLDHGTYTIYCELADHRAKGMEAKLIIP